MINKQLHIVSFSGGKDSTALLCKMLEKGMKVDKIIFCDTGVEFPQMYDHIKKVENYIGREITIVKSEKSFEYYMCDHIKTRGKNKGKKGYGWMDFRNRWCTSQLKIQPYNRYLKQYKKQGYEIIEYHGIAVDEKERTEKNKSKDRIIKYPLVDWEMTEKDCLEYCYSLGFDWGGLYKKFNRVSCYLCPLSRLGEIEIVYKYFPELWNKMKELDKRSFRQFRSDYSLDELEEKFNNK